MAKDPYIYSDQLCINESNPSGHVQWYDDGTNGDEAGDGIISRSIAHLCNSEVNYNDISGFAYGVNLYCQELVALDPSKKGTFQFKNIDTPLTSARSFDTSHAIPLRM